MYCRREECIKIIAEKLNMDAMDLSMLELLNYLKKDDIEALCSLEDEEAQEGELQHDTIRFQTLLDWKDGDDAYEDVVSFRVDFSRRASFVMFSLITPGCCSPEDMPVMQSQLDHVNENRLAWKFELERDTGKVCLRHVQVIPTGSPNLNMFDPACALTERHIEMILRIMCHFYTTYACHFRLLCADVHLEVPASINWQIMYEGDSEEAGQYELWAEEQCRKHEKQD